MNVNIKGGKFRIIIFKTEKDLLIRPAQNQLVEGILLADLIITLIRFINFLV